MEYEIYKTLVASTAHITELDNAELEVDTDTNTLPDLIVYRYGEYGYTIWIPTEGSFTAQSWHNILTRYSVQLRQLLDIAKQKGCKYLRVDCDGPIYDNLPTFQW